MKAEIISIGTEITTGSTLNTNSYFISNSLLEYGIETTHQTSVDDNIERLKKVIEIALDRSDLIITTGGLGPTEDDLTKETVAEYLNLKLKKDEDMKQKIIQLLGKYENIPKNNFKQANLIENSKFLKNTVGTAPGIYLEHGDKTIILLPGPPREMEVMFLNEVIPSLKKNDIKIIKKSINLTGIGESLVEEKIKDIIKMYTDIEVATFGKIQGVEIKMIGRGSDLNTLENKINHLQRLIDARFNDKVYSYNNEPIEKIVFELLEKNNLKISFAESCTGGLLSSKFIRQSGISKVFDRSFVTYSNKSKVEELDVSKKTLLDFGAVSEETSIEMLKGVLNREDTDLAVSITGIAGPRSDSTNKPVGLIYVSIGNANKVITKKLEFIGTRRSIQDRVVDYALFEIRKFILNNY